MRDLRTQFTQGAQTGQTWRVLPGKLLLDAMQELAKAIAG